MQMSVKLLQTKLKLKTTGVYDANTAKAVKDWQRRNPTVKLETTSFGVVDEPTYEAIVKL